MSIRGRFVWEELMTTDTASAAKFYAKIAGLKTKPAAFNASYTTFVASGGRSMGGLMTLPDEAKAGGTPPSWLSYVGTTNVDETARQAAALGGKIAKAPFDIPGEGGRMAILQDPQGAIFAVYTNPKATDMPTDVVPGQMSWHELTTTDINAALSFYQQL